MTDARLEKVYEDRVRAKEFLDQAGRFLGDTADDSATTDSRSVLVHSAVVAACDAILCAVGLRVTAGDRGHVLRISTALEQLPGDTDELEERLDAARERRNEASYAAGPVAQARVSDGREAANELIERADTFLSHL